MDEINKMSGIYLKTTQGEDGQGVEMTHDWL